MYCNLLLKKINKLQKKKKKKKKTITDMHPETKEKTPK